MKKRWFLSPKFWLFVATGLLIAVLASTLPLHDWSMEVRDWLKTLGIWALPTFILIYVVVTILCLPNIVLILIAGTVFGLPLGILSVSIADTLGAIACYGLGRTVVRKRVKRWMMRNPDFAHLDTAVQTKGWKILLLSRLSPLVPSNILNYGFSCTKVNFWHYTFFTWLGMLPIIGLYVYAGYFGSNVLQGEAKPETIALQAAGLIATIIAAITATRMAKKALAEASRSNL